MKVLVVDDSAVMRKVLVKVLSHAGITDVNEAADGEEAVAACEAEDYGLVLMDWNMPKMLGIDAVKQIRANGNSVPIIMVTSETSKRRVMEALKVGADNYITKPFRPELIRLKIEETLEKASESEEH